MGFWWIKEREILHEITIFDISPHFSIFSSSYLFSTSIEIGAVEIQASASSRVAAQWRKCVQIWKNKDSARV